MLTDDELIDGFEAATLPSFPHADHVRLTILYLARHGREETERKLFEGLRRFAAAKGVPQKFHVTMTIAWLDLVDAARRRYPETDDPTALVTVCPQLLDRDALLRFYTSERLMSEDARQRWVAPDRAARIDISISQESNTSVAGSAETERI
jgi:hypothetical protein